MSESLMFWLQKAAYVVVAVALAVALLWVLKRALRVLAGRQVVSEPLIVILQTVARWAVLIVAALVILEVVGIPVDGIWAAVIATGAMVAIGFVAVWSVLSNVFCAVLMLISRPFGVGDEIELMEATSNKGLRAKVIDFNLVFTILRELGEDVPAGDTIAVPNNLFFQKIIRRRPTADSRGLAFHMIRQRSLKEGHRPPQPQPEPQPEPPADPSPLS